MNGDDDYIMIMTIDMIITMMMLVVTTVTVAKSMMIMLKIYSKNNNSIHTNSMNGPINGIGSNNDNAIYFIMASLLICLFYVFNYFGICLCNNRMIFNDLIIQ